MEGEGSVEAMSTSLAVVVDACVLVPAALCDFLLRAAATGLYRLCWTTDILDEVQRTLINDLGKQPEQVARRIAAMTRVSRRARDVSHATHRQHTCRDQREGSPCRGSSRCERRATDRHK